MVVLQLIGQGAFIAASLALAAKLLLLWRRTGEVPELAIGLSFLFGGGLGYIAWFALAAVRLQGADPALAPPLAVCGLAFTIVGATFNGIGVARIYRAGSRWPLAFVGLVVALMLAGWVRYLLSRADTDSVSFWVALVAATPLYLWGAVEALILASALHRRARLGLADPVVVNRVAQWGIASCAVVAMIGLSLGSRIVHGSELPPWVGVANAGFGLVAALAIWLGFFPPQPLRERLARVYAS